VKGQVKINLKSFLSSKSRKQTGQKERKCSFELTRSHSHSRSFFSTRSRDRTGTASLPLVFETSASTNSAIRAFNYFGSISNLCFLKEHHLHSIGWRNWPPLQSDSSLKSRTAGFLNARPCHPGIIPSCHSYSWQGLRK
jgi:hypothetical protein